MWKTSSLILNQLDAKHKYVFILVINVALLLVFISIADIQVLMYFGGWLFFLTSLMFSKIISIKSLIGLFFLLSFPFLFIGITYTSLKYYNTISLESLSSIYIAFIFFLLSFSVGFLIGILIQKTINNSILKLSFFVSITCLVFATLAGFQGWAFQFVFTGLIYFIGGFLNKAKSLRHIVIFYSILVLPFSIALGSFFLINGLSHVYPIIIIPFISSFVGILCNYQISKSYFKSGFGIGIIYLIILGMGYWGMKNYLQYIFGLADRPYVKELKFDCYNPSDSSFNNNDISGKTTVIYFHTKSCKVCYEKLPELESLYNDFKYDTNIIIIAAFVPYSQSNDSSFIFNYYKSKGFSFPQYQTREGSEEYERRFNIDGYPHVTIISKYGDIIHNGLFNNDPTVFVDNTKLFILSDY